MAGKSEEFSIEEKSFDLCTPCLVADTREEAVRYCPDCQEYLCLTCIKYHRRVTATRGHELIVRSETKQCPVKCVYHPERDVEMYCGTDDMVYCLKCIADDHRSCNGLKSIEKVSATQVRDEIQVVEEEMKILHDRLEAAYELRQKNSRSVEKQRYELSHKIQEAESSLIEHIRKLKTQAIETLNTHCSKVQEDLEWESTIVNSLTGEVERLTWQLETDVNPDQGQQFALAKLIHKSVNETKNTYENTEFNDTHAVYFTKNLELQSSVMQATALGKTHVITKKVRQVSSRNYKVKSKVWVDVKILTDKSKCIISDVCILRDGTVVLTDQGNNKVKMLNKNYEIQGHCVLDAVPTGICCTGINEVCVKMNNNKLQFITVGASLLKQGELQIKDGCYYGIAFLGGELWVSRRNGISVYNTSGTLIKSFDADQDEKKIFKTDTIQHMSVRGETVIVTDHADGAVCLDRDGTVEREFRDKRLNKAGGVSVSNTGTVFISGYRSDNVVMFRGDGTCLGELVPKDAALKFPISLCYDGNKNCIIVSCENSNNIYVFELEY